MCGRKGINIRFLYNMWPLGINVLLDGRKIFLKNYLDPTQDPNCATYQSDMICVERESF